MPTPPVAAGEDAADAAQAADTSRGAAGSDPAQTYRAWLKALSRRDVETACRLQHPDFTINLRLEAILQKRAELGDPCVDFEALLWEDPERSLRISDLETTRQTEEKATLAARYAPGSPTQAATIQLEFQRAAWRVLSEAPRELGTADTARWVNEWCGLTSLDTREEIIDAMGEPSGIYTVDDGGDPQIYWVKEPYDFRAFFDPVGGGVTDLVGDYDGLSAADRAQLICPELR